MCQSKSLGKKLIIWEDFYRKLHENEKKWTGGPYSSLGSANIMINPGTDPTYMLRTRHRVLGMKVGAEGLYGLGT